LLFQSQEGNAGLVWRSNPETFESNKGEAMTSRGRLFASLVMVLVLMLALAGMA